MRNIRIVARLDVKAPNLVKGIQFEGLRKLGDPHQFAKKYYLQGVDEIYYEDIVASLYDRNGLFDLIEETTSDIFVPVTVGGGLRTIEDVSRALRFGADKVSINSAAIKRPELISEVAARFGSQAMVLSIQAKRTNSGWEAYFDNGREHSGVDAVQWALEGEKLGAGELIVASVDQEGTGNGYDVELMRAVTEIVKIPVVASGGMGKLDHIRDVAENGRIDALAIARSIHYDIFTIQEIRTYCQRSGIPVRHFQDDFFNE